MRSFLLILGLLITVTLAFVIGVFVGVRYQGSTANPPELAEARDGTEAAARTAGDAATSAAGEGAGATAGQADGGGPDGQPSGSGGGKEPANGAGTADQRGTASGNGGGTSTTTAGAGGTTGGSGGGAGRSARDSGGDDGAAGADPAANGQSADGQDGSDGETWLSKAVPAPGDREAVSGNAASGGAVAPSNPGPPDVLTPTQTDPGAPVYAVQTARAVPRQRAVELARRLSGDKASARVIPVLDGESGADASGDSARSHVRLSAFAERAAASAAAERGMRAVDVRLRVVRVRRPDGAGGQTGDGNAGGAPADSTGGSAEGAS